MLKTYVDKNRKTALNNIEIRLKLLENGFGITNHNNIK